MSLTRQFFREFRPLFRMLEEPFGRSPAFYRPRGIFEDPFFHSPNALRPAVDVTEEGKHYIVEAELPGVKKENVEVRIGDGGRSITIEGKVVDRRGEPPVVESTIAEGASAPAEGSTPAESTGTEVTNPAGSNQISTERSFVGTSTFTRTVWLPRQVDSAGVTATLNDGILTVKVPKAEDPGSVSIPVQ
ncbi:hypothetical protein NLI96_g4075 [Meripilus lineatus]|uniref:SHSP domain-containing protein n=1 Tax=Meripilus lineatus TaxID=2056292 RepID=A0AAD5V5I7_9APHY|nr:hypothetical protein NLI96_g4075 [Physisporinus lineatus]